MFKSICILEKFNRLAQLESYTLDSIGQMVLSGSTEELIDLVGGTDEVEKTLGRALKLSERCDTPVAAISLAVNLAAAGQQSSIGPNAALLQKIKSEAEALRKNLGIGA